MQTLVDAVLTLAAAGVSSLVTAFVMRRPRRVAAEAQQQATINEGFTALLKAAMESNREMQLEMVQLRGELRNLDQHILSLEEELRRHGIPLPKRPLVLVGGRES